MPKAEITLPSGAKITIEASDREIRELVDHYAAAGNTGKQPARQARIGTPREREVEGPTGHLRHLKDEGFFGRKRSLGAVQERLAELGHIYPQTTLSPILIKLTKRRELRRMKEKGIWVYVSP